MAAAEQYNTLAGQLSEWWAQRSRKQLIEQAEQLARADVAALTGDRVRLRLAAADEKCCHGQIGGQAVRSRKPTAATGGPTEYFDILNDRLGAQQQLVALYVKWGDKPSCNIRSFFTGCCNHSLQSRLFSADDTNLGLNSLRARHHEQKRTVRRF